VGSDIPLSGFEGGTSSEVIPIPALLDQGDASCKRLQIVHRKLLSLLLHDSQNPHSRQYITGQCQILVEHLEDEPQVVEPANLIIDA